MNTQSLRKSRSVWCLPVMLAAAFLAVQACQSGPKPPVAEKMAKELTVHGQTRIDNYYWLNERENPKVLEYLKAENAYLEARMARTKPLQDKLYGEIIGRMKQDDSTVPYRTDGHYYYERYEQGKEYALYCRKKGSLDAAEEIMLDGPAMARGHAFFSIAGVTASPDTTHIAYGIDTVSRRKYTIHFKNLAAGRVLPDELPNTDGRAVWANDSKTVFYVVKEENLRPFKVMKHVLGTDVTRDAVVFTEADVTFEVGLYKSKSKKYVMIASESTLSDEVRFCDASKPDGPWTVLQPRERELEYGADHLGDSFYLLTNWQAKNFRLMKTPEKRTARENWKEIVPHRADVFLEDVELFNNFYVLNERMDGLNTLRVISWKGKDDYTIDFGDPTYTAGLSINPEPGTDIVRYEYSSLTTPDSIYDFDMKTRIKTLRKQQEVLGGFKAANYTAERIYATAKDGVKVPVSLVYRQGFVQNGQAACLLYGYGSYGYSTDASFDSPIVSLLDRGFVYAIAHIRGGSEMGRPWYEDGKLLKKKNTFTDFIAAGDELVAKKYTSPDRLFAMGGSAGGLLMGAVINTRPDLFRGVIAGVPYVDVITTMLDSSIPLTTSEYDEWGNPNNKEFYDYMLSYSPYDNVEAKDYPALLVTTGLHDSQVQYWEPAKWVAKLRAMKTDKNPLYLLTNMEAGHGGKSGRLERYREVALEMAFMLDLAGIKE